MNNNYLYELGKWLGDRRGFPRVGIINTELQLVKDTNRFLEKQFKQKPVLRKITKKENKTMFGEEAYETFIVSSPIHKRLENEIQKIKEDINSLKKKQILSFLSGFIDAEGTIDLKNDQIVISVGKKNEEIKELIYLLIKRLEWEVRVWDCVKEWKISVKSNKEIIKQLKKNVKHPQKKALLNFNIANADKKYLDYIQNVKKVKSLDLKQKFCIHEDSARRILRYFTKLKKIKKITKTRPYVYVPI